MLGEEDIFYYIDSDTYPCYNKLNAADGFDKDRNQKLDYYIFGN